MNKYKLTEKQLKLIKEIITEAIRGPKNLETDEDSTFLASTTSRTIKLARERIKEMNSSPILSNMLSIFIVLLTDPDSTAVMKSLGTQYGKQIKKYTDKEGLDFEETMVKALKPKLKRLLLGIFDEIKNNQSDEDPIKDSDEKKQVELDQDKLKLQNIKKRFNLI